MPLPFATPQPDRPVTPVDNWPSLSQARRQHDAGDPDLAAQHAKLDEEQQRRSARGFRMVQLQANVDRASNELAIAEDRTTFFKQRIAELRETVKLQWGAEQTIINVDPAFSLIEAYGSITTLLDAMADWPRCRELLVKNVNAAKLVLDNFTRDQS